MNRIKTRLLAMAIAGITCATAVADTIELHRDKSVQTLNNVKIRDVKEDQLVFLSEGGNELQRPLSIVYRIEITGETALNDAEKAYAAETWPEATDAYNRALKTATKPWIKDRISLRLVDLAGKTNRFDVAAAGYVGLVASNPTLAATVKPTLSTDKAALTGAVEQVEHALGDSKLTADKKITLLQFELELQNALGDKKAAGAVVEKMLATGGLDANDPAMQKQVGDLKVAVAQLALDNKDFARATASIEESKAILTDPAQQAQALYILAESKYQQALAAKTTEKTAWQDIAIAYMRVVALFPTSPNAGDSLARTASCYEQMNENEKAINVYQKVASNYPNTPAAKSAQESITRLKAGN